jgi:ATP/ADP translocase
MDSNHTSTNTNTSTSIGGNIKFILKDCFKGIPECENYHTNVLTATTTTSSSISCLMSFLVVVVLTGLVVNKNGWNSGTIILAIVSFCTFVSFIKFYLDKTTAESENELCLEKAPDC